MNAVPLSFQDSGKVLPSYAFSVARYQGCGAGAGAGAAETVCSELEPEPEP